MRDPITTGGVFDAAITGVTFGVSSGVAILFNTFLISLIILHFVDY